MHEVIGERLFTDFTTRKVFQAPVGRQYVLDDDLNEIFGNWILTPELEEDTPIVVPRGTRP